MYSLVGLHRLVYREFRKFNLDKHEHILESYYQQKVQEIRDIFQHMCVLKDLHNKELILGTLQHIFVYNYLQKIQRDTTSHKYEFNFPHKYPHQPSKFQHKFLN